MALKFRTLSKKPGSKHFGEGKELWLKAGKLLNSKEFTVS